MIKNLLCFGILFTIIVNTRAQTFNVSWGERVKITNEFDDAVPIGNGKQIVFKIKQPKRMFSMNIPENYLMIVNAKMETELESEEIKLDEKNGTIKGFEKYGNNIFLMYEAYDKETKTTSEYALKVNEKTLALTNKKTLGTFEADNRNDQAKSLYKLSADSTKILLFSEGPERRKENKHLFITVFDTDLNKIWKKDVELPILEKFISIYDQDITNDGNVFVATKVYDKEVTRETVREDGSKIPSYVYKINVFTKESAKPKEIAFNLNNLFIQGTKLTYSKNGSITVAGLYKTKSNGNLNGVFYGTLDANSTEIKNPKIVPFDSEIIRLVDKDRFGTDKSKDPGLYTSFRIKHIMRRSNGSVDLISEYYRWDAYTTTNSRGGMQNHVRYEYGDIVNTNIDKEGKAVFTRIPKDQLYIDSEKFQGYFPFLYNDKLVLLYNDDKDNVDRDLEKRPDDVLRFDKSVFVAATIDAKGVLTRQAIFSNDDENYVTIPRNTTCISPTKYLITADLTKLFKKGTRFGFLEVK